ncbi:hypothetical protein N7450_007057 [Penicillium hetheringtonii]|uniref:60S ribosomal protein L13 n=1 Tax=Penicillium hetheringtonii TaxID=911720 RepID=A0AAD6DGY5_9EURO|nr:hypothetical protein N7450_007057 [Penicillium hetheringtonii]
MAIKHNNQIQKNHFRKDWQKRVRVHFDQPGRKHRRRENRLAKAAAVAPRPVDKLRPVVRCPTVKYNRRVRAGRGFTLAELKEAGIPKKLAPTVGISVDHRRVNYSKESLVANVARLKDYKARLILFPARADVKAVKASLANGTRDGVATYVGATFPITNPTPEEAITEVKRDSLPKGEEAAYRKLRDSRAEARHRGKREARAKAKAEEEANAKK